MSSLWRYRIQVLQTLIVISFIFYLFAPINQSIDKTEPKFETARATNLSSDENAKDETEYFAIVLILDERYVGIFFDATVPTTCL